MFFDSFFVFGFFVGFVEDVVFFVFQIITAKAVVAVPEICAPVAVRDPVGPVDVRAFVKVSAETAVVALFEGVGDRTAVHAVFASAFQAGFDDVEAIFAFV